MRLTGRRLIVPALAVFVAGNLFPRSPVFVHRHADGEHAHVHPWGADHDPATPVHHHHRHERPSVRPGAALTAPDGDEGVHPHWQHPYQLAARPEPSALVRHEAVAALVAAADGRIGADRPGTPTARGPPDAPRPTA
jgi:hypothetical protein